LIIFHILIGICIHFFTGFVGSKGISYEKSASSSSKEDFENEQPETFGRGGLHDFLVFLSYSLWQLSNFL
jgi:hypothetical protein